jgi:hypothetical protein
METHLGCLVLASGDEVCPIGSPLEIHNEHVQLVNLNVVELITRLHLVRLEVS